MRTKLIYAAMAVILTMPSPSLASTKWTGKIYNFFGSSPNNNAFRVTLAGPAMTGCSFNYAYINPSEGNYNTYVSMLLTAYSLQKTVDLFVTPDASGFCHLDEMAVY